MMRLAMMVWTNCCHVVNDYVRPPIVESRDGFQKTLGLPSRILDVDKLAPAFARRSAAALSAGSLTNTELLTSTRSSSIAILRTSNWSALHLAITPQVVALARFPVVEDGPRKGSSERRCWSTLSLSDRRLGASYHH
jgi:hypothetical protein